MSNEQYLMLALTCGAGIVGLFLAASGGQGSAYTLGLALFVAAVGLAFHQIKRHFDRIDRMRH